MRFLRRPRTEESYELMGTVVGVSSRYDDLWVGAVGIKNGELDELLGSQKGLNGSQ